MREVFAGVAIACLLTGFLVLAAVGTRLDDFLMAALGLGLELGKDRHMADFLFEEGPFIMSFFFSVAAVVVDLRGRRSGDRG